MVQGIGYRPFVAELAEEYQITGWVRNTAGIVTIWAEGDDCRMEQFLLALSKEAPKGARIDAVEQYQVAPQGFSDFRIEESEEETAARVVPYIPPDLPTCPICEAQLSDKADRRYRYPFISCTSCGPRYSILEALPYDRPNITMRDFPMCEACETEYTKRGDIRRHAQTIACPSCGPKLRYLEPGNTPSTPLTGEQAVRQAVDLLRAGGIVALKDIGGFHLACSPYSEETLEALRRIKGREKKPFAVMFPDVTATAEYCEINDAEREQLLSTPRPIVLLKKKDSVSRSTFSDNVCGNSPDIGAMLPCNPLHLLLMQELGALIMTSANRSGELIITENERMRSWMEEAASLLEGETIPLGILEHDRRILTPLDDSIVRMVCGKRQVFRRARGMVPAPITLPINPQSPSGALFAAGGDLKACFCYAEGGRAYLSQHFGDLEDEESYLGYQREIRRVKRLFDFHPEYAAVDMHPMYLSAEVNPQIKEFLLKEPYHIQHHHAHAASVLAEHGLTGKTFCVAFDGTGYGFDGSIWGSEFFGWDGQQMKRVSHLLPVTLPGGNAGAKNADAMLYGYFASYGEAFKKKMKTTWGKLPWLSEASFELVQKAVSKGINSITSTSMGRLFDAVSALLDICHYNSYEGEAAIELEYLAAKTTQTYPLAIAVEEREAAQAPYICYAGNTEPLMKAIIDALRNGVPTEELARGFLYAVADYISETAERLAACLLQPDEKKQITLSGGTFQNRILLETVIPKLEAQDFTVYINEQVPPGDGGISLGQAYILNHKILS